MYGFQTSRLLPVHYWIIDHKRWIHGGIYLWLTEAAFHKKLPNSPWLMCDRNIQDDSGCEGTELVCLVPVLERDFQDRWSADLDRWPGKWSLQTETWHPSRLMGLPSTCALNVTSTRHLSTMMGPQTITKQGKTNAIWCANNFALHFIWLLYVFDLVR